MELVLWWFGVACFGAVGVAFVSAVCMMWYRRKKCSATMIYDSLLTIQPDADRAAEIGFYPICLDVVRIASLLIPSGFLAWVLLQYGRSIYINYTGLQLHEHTQPQVPCYFIFGDSLVDNGNNNLLNTAAKANYFPYGIDYPTGPTGRFSNGRNIADFIAEYLGFEEPIPANAYASGMEIMKGVNYGSGSAGIRDETGKLDGERISFDGQLRNHNTTVSRIGTFLGENATSYLKTCLYTVGLGSNDYINNYLMSDYFNTSSEYTPTEYAAALIQQYSEQLKTLYNYGARKVAIFGIGLIGCAPYEIASTGSSECYAKANTDAEHFDIELPLLVDTFNKNFTDAQFIYVNITHIGLTPAPDTGITITEIPCCITSTKLSAGQCIPNEEPCKNRTTHTFFDAFHPAEYYAKLEAERAYTAATPLDVYPFGIQSLAQLQL